MQTVEGSNPFSRFKKPPFAGLFRVRSRLVHLRRAGPEPDPRQTGTHIDLKKALFAGDSGSFEKLTFCEGNLKIMSSVHRVSPVSVRTPELKHESGAESLDVGLHWLDDRPDPTAITAATSHEHAYQRSATYGDARKPSRAIKARSDTSGVQRGRAAHAAPAPGSGGSLRGPGQFSRLLNTRPTRVVLCTKGSYLGNRVEAPASREERQHFDLALYRIVQEALTNAHKHASTSRVTVELVEDEATVELSIHDNGNGFDPTALSQGFGLGGMRERVELLAGTLDIQSTAGEGTTVAAKLPALRRGEAAPFADPADRQIAADG